MGVYINNMMMPEDCGKCAFAKRIPEFGNFNVCCTAGPEPEIIRTEGPDLMFRDIVPIIFKPEWCPLVACEERPDPSQWTEAVETVTSYNGLDEIVKRWKELPVKDGFQEGYIECPKNYGATAEEAAETFDQLQVIWMMAVSMFGEWGTSPRFGWIEKVQEFKQWVDKIARPHMEPDEYEESE